ncbi:MAG: imidazolonepropionase [Bacteroidia bacterium]
MSALLIKNIKQLVGINTSTIKRGKMMRELECINDAWLFMEDGVIKDFGDNTSTFNIQNSKFKIVDASGRLVLPSYCDSHTHLVYAGTREGEFVDRINGLSYEEIFSRGGGILNSANRLREASEEELFESAWYRLEEIMRMGTGAVEIKSGYGLSVDSELKMLRIIKRLKEKSPLTIKATFLGAHAVPIEFKNNKSGYIDLIINEMMPAIAAEKLADYCDIFCEQNYFSYEDTLQFLEAGAKHGMIGKVHAEQLSHSNGIKAGVESHAISVDHLEFCNDDDIKFLKNSDTIPTILPGAQFFLSLKNPPARQMIDAGLPVAIASDYNPGSSPSGNMNMMMSLACVNYKMTPEECINATTINSAYAMGVHNELGSIAIGKKANVFITKEIPSYNFIPYSFANNLVETVILNGEVL